MSEEKRLVPVRVLLLSSDAEVVESLSQTARSMAIQIEKCSDPELAMIKLARSKFEGVVVDLGLKDAFEFLGCLRKLSLNRSAVSYAVLRNILEQLPAFQAGANFVFERPVSHSAARVFKASYSLMVRERRRYFRYPVRCEVVVQQGKAEFAGTSVNLSETGISLKVGESIAVGSKLVLRLRLPGEEQDLQLSGEVCWAEESGRIGVHLRNLNPQAAQMLREFLTERLEESVCAKSAAAEC